MSVRLWLVLIIIASLGGGWYFSWHKKQVLIDEARPPADRLIDLALGSQQSDSLVEARKRMEKLLQHLGLPGEVVSQYSRLPLRSIRFMPNGLTAESVENAIVLAAGPVKLRSATNALVVTAGPINVEVLRGTLLLSSADIHVDVDLGEPLSSVLVAKGPIEIAKMAKNSALYSPVGATLPAEGVAPTGIRAYNTEVFTAFPWQIAQSPAPAVFSGEPVREANAIKQVRAPSNERTVQLNGAGQRCDPKDPPNELSRPLADSVRQAARCDTIDRVSVRCLGAERDATGFLQSVEYWEFELCGQKASARLEKKSPSYTDSRIEVGAR